MSVNETTDTAGSAPVIKFEHKFFASVGGSFFAVSGQTGEPALFVKLGDVEVALPLRGIVREFMIDEASTDGRMLTMVADALGYVTGLRIGDPLPREVFSDSASWSPTERHLTIAYQRLTMQLVTWLSGDEHIISNPDELMQVANDPAAQKKVNMAFTEAAEKLGLGRERRQEVVGYIEKLAHELAYIEALRDRFQRIVIMENKIQGLRRLYGTERSVLEVADPVARLMEIAVRQFRSTFEEVDAQTSEILAVLKNIDGQMKFISSTRNNLFRRLAAWDEIVEKWKPVAVRVSAQIPDLIRETYHFLAPRFMQVKEWALATQPERERKKATRSMVW